MDSVVTPRLVLGTAQWGMRYGIANRGGQPSLSQIAEMLKLASDNGVWTLDTARAYGDSEQIIGSLTENDSRWTIVTKIPPLRDENDPATAAVASFDASRKALRRDRIDIVLLHDPADRFRAAGAVWQELGRLREQKYIGALGVSAIAPDDALRDIEDSSVEALQVAASLFDQRLDRRGFFDRARGRDTRVFIRSVFLQGVAYLDPDALPQFLAELRGAVVTVQSWAARHGCAVVDLLLGYARDVLGYDVVIGCEQPEQLAANLRAFAAITQLSIDELAQLVPALPDDVVSPALWPKQS